LPAASTELSEALRSCRSAFLGTAMLSGLINILMLTGSFYMLEIYDRVLLPSRSVPTLVGLTVVAGVLFGFLGVLDLIRGRLLVRIGASLDETLSGRVYDTIVRLPLRAGNRGDGLQPLRDLDSVRVFLSSLGPTALFDLPWMPIYLAICFAFRVAIGIAALAGAIFLIALTFLTESLTREPLKATTALAMARNGLAERSRRNAEVLMSMGMAIRVGRLWTERTAITWPVRNKRATSPAVSGRFPERFA
jgi:ATP-binding cassette subfamily C protein PrsD